MEGKSWAGVLTVTDVTCTIGEMLESRALQDIWVRGELSNVKQHNSGHLYFTLGDPDALLQCIMWRADARNLQFQPEDGMDVLAYGSIGIHPLAGRYQFYVRELALSGEGERHILVERWKRELEEEGLFEMEKKRPLPPYPRRIGVVTSESGAVLHDIATVLSRRFPLEIVLSPTAVQGENAHREIAEAIRRVDGRCDVIILARGGGSFEDLFPFNHPDVVRAVRSCTTPLISAIGHEVDVTLSDFAADQRAPTPSAAAELAVPDRTDLLQELMDHQEHLNRSLATSMSRYRKDLADLVFRIHPRRLSRRLDPVRMEIQDLSERLTRGARASFSTVALHRERMEAALGARVWRSRSALVEASVWLQPRHLLRRVEDARSALGMLTLRLDADLRTQIERERIVLAESRVRLAGNNPRSVLARGYCYIEKGSVPIGSIRQLSIGDRIVAHLQDGRSEMRVERIER